MANIGTKLFTWLHGSYVGEDEFGNRYFVERADPKNRRRRRWVIYKGMNEPSKIPAHWHGWLHYTQDNPPSGKPERGYEWQVEHKPNLTGTTGAYLPCGHVLRGGSRKETASDYEPWNP